MNLIRIRPKGQITPPLSVRKAVQANVGDYLVCEVRDDSVILRKAPVYPRVSFNDGIWRLVGSTEDREAKLVLTNFVVAETYNLLAVRAYLAKAREWLLANTWPVERVSEKTKKEARRILEKYKNFSYTDATSFALMARLSFDLAFTYDSHFAQYGLRTQEDLAIPKRYSLNTGVK